VEVGNASSSWAWIIGTRVEQEVDRVEQRYEEKFYAKVKEEVEATIIAKRVSISDAKILEEL
jgi:hypothetical protein